MSQHIQTTPTAVNAATFTVRLAEEDEFEAVGELTVRGFATGPYAHLPRSEARQTLERDAGARAGDGGLLVAVDDRSNEFLGTATITREFSPIARQARDGEAELRLVAVAPEARGRGVAQALVQASIDLAAEWGVTALILDTGPLNYTAQRNYLRAGFQRVPERELTVEPGVGRPLIYRYPFDSKQDHRIRLVRHTELDAVADLTEAAYTADYRVSAGYRTSLRAVAERASQDEVWVAEDRATGEILGTVWTPREGSTLTDVVRGNELDFRLLAVAHSARGRGIGEALVRQVIALGHLRGVDRVVLSTTHDMVPAQRLYERLGFERLPERESTVEIEPGFVLDILAYGYDLGRTASSLDEVKR